MAIHQLFYEKRLVSLPNPDMELIVLKNARKLFFQNPGRNHKTNISYSIFFIFGKRKTLYSQVYKLYPYAFH